MRARLTRRLAFALIKKLPMKYIPHFIIGCIALAVLRWAVFALVAIGALLLVGGAIFKPRETFGLLGFLLFRELLFRYPLTVCGLFGLSLLGDVVRRWLRKGAAVSPGEGALKQLSYFPERND